MLAILLGSLNPAGVPASCTGPSLGAGGSSEASLGDRAPTCKRAIAEDRSPAFEDAATWLCSAAEELSPTFRKRRNGCAAVEAPRLEGPGGPLLLSLSLSDMSNCCGAEAETSGAAAGCVAGGSPTFRSLRRGLMGGC